MGFGFVFFRKPPQPIDNMSQVSCMCVKAHRHKPPPSTRKALKKAIVGDSCGSSVVTESTISESDGVKAQNYDKKN